MARKSKLLRPGLGAKCSCLIRFLHPSAEIKAKILNPTHGQRLSGLVLVSQATHCVNWIDQKCYKFCHNNFKNLLIYTPIQWVKVELKGQRILYSLYSLITIVVVRVNLLNLGVILMTVYPQREFLLHQSSWMKLFVHCIPQMTLLWLEQWIWM